MRKILTLIVLIMMTVSATFAQNEIKGQIIDSKTKEPLPGASVVITGTSKGVISDFDGNFVLQTSISGQKKLAISFIGFDTKEVEVNISGTVDLGVVSLESNTVGLDEVSVIASIAKDRQTPVAVASLKADVIEAKTGNMEFPEIMKSTPSVYATKQGGGYGDARINIRGFDQRNVAVMINGIPVNDMENGWVYWSNWAGLADVASTIQIQRGLGASKLAVPSVGGSINIITNAADNKKGGNVTMGIGNDGYSKYGVVLSTGLMDNGWAITAQGTHTRGDGYVDGTLFRAWSYFLAITKKINDKHMIAITGLGAPQWHNQRSISNYDAVTLETYDEFGKRFNPHWGEKDGDEFSWRKNFYHKPKFYLNHYWTISDKTNVKTSAYVSLGRGGGTGPRGRINGPNGRIYDSYTGSDDLLRDANGQIRWDDMVKWNQGQAVNVDNWGQKEADTEGEFAGKYTTSSSGNGFIRRASMNEHNWYGILSTLSHQMTDQISITAGIDARYYKGIHYRKLDDLLGNDAYLSRSDKNNPQNYITDPDEKYEDGNILGYHNDGLVRWLGLFTQLEYVSGPVSAFVSLSGSNQAFKRIDYFNYLDDNAKQESDWETFMGGTIKAGLNYNINDNHNVFVNAGYISRQPIFDNVFINYVNDVNKEAKNQSIVAFEAGYGFRSRNLRANINLYHTKWGNRQFDRSTTIMINDSTQHDGQAIFDNVSELHQGLEIDFSYAPIPLLTINGMASFGKWEYTEDFTATLTDIDASQTVGKATLYAEELKVGDAAQTTIGVGIDLKPFKGALVYLNYTYYDNLYADFDITDGQFYEPNPVIVKLPSYGLVDLGGSYKFDLGKMEMSLRFNVNNLLDEEYVAELDTNIDDDFKKNQGFYGFGRTWNLGLKVKF